MRVTTPITDGPTLERCVNEYARNNMCEVLYDAVLDANKPRLQATVRPLLEKTAERIGQLVAKYDRGSNVMNMLLTDLDGQLMLAAEVDKLKTWGPGAIYAAINAHYHRICVNFKDRLCSRWTLTGSLHTLTAAARKAVRCASSSGEALSWLRVSEELIATDCVAAMWPPR